MLSTTTPGAWPWCQLPSFSWPGNVLSYTRYDATSGPEQQKLSSSTFGLSPSLFAGEVPKKVVGDNRIAYSFMTRQQTKLRLQGRGSTSGSDFDVPNLNVLADNLQVEQDMSEHWFGVSYSRRATAYVDFGVTTYLAVRNQAMQTLNFATALGNGNRAGVALLTLRLHLDGCEEKQGALRVIPASHNFGRLPTESIPQFTRGSHEICCVPKGGLLATKPLLLHSSPASVTGGHRRVIHLDFAVRTLPTPLEWHEKYRW